MLDNIVWISAVPEIRGMLCIGCLEKRLGRKLIFKDFEDCGLNTHFNIDDKSDRLLERMGISKEHKRLKAK